MKRLPFTTTVMALAALGVVVAAPQNAHAQYAIDYLISPYQPNIVDSWMFGINNNGQATGYVTGKDANGKYAQNAVIYRNGEVQTLASTPGFQFSAVTYGSAINDRGDVAGNSGGLPTFFAASGGATPINTPGMDYNRIYGLNNAGTVLVNGFSQDAATGYQENFVLWKGGQSQILTSLEPLYPNILPPDPNDPFSGPFTVSYSNGVTNLSDGNQFAAGVVTGTVTVDPLDPNNLIETDQQLAFVYDGQNGYHLLAPFAADDAIVPVNTEADGSVFGWDGDHLALWNADGSFGSLLPDYAGGLRGSGYAGSTTVQRNSLGQVVAVTNSGGIAWYDPNLGAWTDITSSIQGLGTGTFSSIQGYNDRGQFVGLVRPPTGGGIFGYVVTAVPEPGNIALLASIGISGAVFLVRRRKQTCKAV